MTPFPDGKYCVILADPPWNFKNYTSERGDRDAANHYTTLSIDDIIALPVKQTADSDCHLFMWTTGPHLQQAFRVIEGWGFRYSSIAFTWVKMRKNCDDKLFNTGRDMAVGLGHTTRKNTEICLLGRRGSPKRISKSVRELIIASRREHSRKPEEIYDRIEQYAAGPYLELFARSTRLGWASWGNEVGKFDNADEGQKQLTTAQHPSP